LVYRHSRPTKLIGNGSTGHESQGEDPSTEEDGTSAVLIYEQTIKDPKQDSSSHGSGSQANGNKIEIETEDMQSFLGQQVDVLEQLKIEDEKDRAARKIPKQLEMSPNLEETGRVNEHIGPVQFNMGGIQVDADDMLRKLKVGRPYHSPGIRC